MNICFTIGYNMKVSLKIDQFWPKLVKLKGCQRPGMMVSEISATGHDIFTKFVVFAIGMKIWPMCKCGQVT